MKTRHVPRIIFVFTIVSIILSLWLIAKPMVNNETIPSSTRIPTLPVPSLSQNTDSFIVRAAIPYWDQENAVSSLKKHADLIDYFSLFWYYLDDEGSIQKYNSVVEDASLITFAHDNNIQVSAVITNLPEEGTWDSSRVENIIAGEEKMTRCVGNIRSLLRRLILVARGYRFFVFSFSGRQR